MAYWTRHELSSSIAPGLPFVGRTIESLAAQALERTPPAYMIKARSRDAMYADTGSRPIASRYPARRLPGIPRTARGRTRPHIKRPLRLLTAPARSPLTSGLRARVAGWPWPARRAAQRRRLPYQRTSMADRPSPAECTGSDKSRASPMNDYEMLRCPHHCCIITQSASRPPSDCALMRCAAWHLQTSSAYVKPSISFDSPHRRLRGGW